MDSQSFLLSGCIYLGAAVIAVPIAKRLGLGATLGYLLSGIVIGPWGLGLVKDAEQIMHFAEFGVVLMLFLVGLELKPRVLWQLRRTILGLGGLQVAVTTLIIAAIAMYFGMDFPSGVVTGMGLALSSTAIALQLLNERNLLRSSAGQASFSVLLFQDIAILPMLAFVSLLGGPMASGGTSFDLQHVLIFFLAIGGLIVGGKILVRPLFGLIARTNIREIGTAFSLLIVIGAALIMHAAGLSMALGTFIAGVLLADSEYRHALEADINPFKGLLLGLFFISVGIAIDFGLALQHPATLVTLVLGLVTVKATILYALGHLFHLRGADRTFFAFALSQGGEFAFVLFSFALSGHVITGETAAMLVTAVALSMFTTPLLMVLFNRVIEPWAHRPEERAADIIDEQHTVIIAGFGRFGQIVGRLLHVCGIDATVLDHDANHIDMMRQFGYKVFYGDASQVDLLEAAGAAKARVFVLAVDDVEHSMRIVEIVQQHFPNLAIVARARDRDHAHRLINAGVTILSRETFESSLQLAEQTLKLLGFPAYEAKRATHMFRQHDLKTLHDMAPYFEDMQTRISMAANARAELEALFKSDEKEIATHEDEGWE